MVFESKKAIRRHIKSLTTAIPMAEKQRQALVVDSALRDIIGMMDYPTVALFSPLGDELPIDIDSMAEVCRILLPKVDATTSTPLMEFYDYLPDSLQAGAYGIDEPSGGNPISCNKIDLAIIPAVAFTNNGDRLGRGKGYYDCYLSRDGFRAHTIGVCFNHQLLPSLPTEPHDRRVDKVVTASIIEQND